MTRFPTLLKYELINVLRGRWVIAYVVLLGGFSEAVLRVGGDSGKAVLSLLSVVLLIVPLVSILFASVYWYSSDRFTTFLLTQPQGRAEIVFARWLAVSISLGMSFILGVLGPLAWNEVFDGASLLLVGVGLLMTGIFVGLGLWVSVLFQDRTKGMGAAFVLWFYFTVVHDGLTFLIFSSWHDYPLELPGIVLTTLNPVALGRVVLLMAFDFSAVMGYTGAFLQKFFLGGRGATLVVIAFLAWLAIPVGLEVRAFAKRNL